jgi:hypothetical protein
VFHKATRIAVGSLIAGTMIAGAGAALADQGVASAHSGAQASAAARGTVAAARRALAGNRLQRTVLTVKSVSGTTIDATTRAGVPITITTTTGGTNATTFTEAGATVSISAVQPNEHILVAGTFNRVNRTAAARRVVIVVPAVSGVVTNVSGTTITLTDRNATQHTIDLGSAKVERAGQTVSMQSIVVGSLVTVQLAPNSGSAVSVLRVVVHVPSFAGTISNASGSSFTLTTAVGKTYTVSTSASTVIVQRKAAGAGTGSTPTPATPTIANGERAIVQGTVNGTGVSALRIAVWQPKATTTGNGTGSSGGQSA